MATRRELTAAEQECARRIRELWLKKQHGERVSQPDAAEALGITQGGFSQFITAKVPIPPAMKVRMAKYLGVDIIEIDPEFYDDLGLINPNLDGIELQAIQQFRALKGDQKAMLLGILISGVADLKRASTETMSAAGVGDKSPDTARGEGAARQGLRRSTSKNKTLSLEIESGTDASKKSQPRKSQGVVGAQRDPVG